MKLEEKQKSEYFQTSRLLTTARIDSRDLPLPESPVRPRESRVILRGGEKVIKQCPAEARGLRLNETLEAGQPSRWRVTRALKPRRARSVGYQIESSCLSYFPREFSGVDHGCEIFGDFCEVTEPVYPSGKFDTVARSSRPSVDD